MHALAFWKAVTLDRSDFLGSLIALLDQAEVRYCVIGGQAVNAYTEPVVSLDLDLAVASADLERARSILGETFEITEFEHSYNIGARGSDLRVQLQKDPRYGSFVDRSARRRILGLELPVASLEDVIRSKVWAVQDPARRGSKRQKDLADIARLLEFSPELRRLVPVEVLSRLF